MEKYYSTGQVAKILNTKPHQIAYANANGDVEEPAMTFLNKRAFSENDIERLRELRAEITSAFILSELNVPQSQDMTNHHVYLEHWLDHLQKDNKFIFRTSTATSKAVDYLLRRNNQEDIV